MPLYLQESLQQSRTSVATVPLTMYISGFGVAIVIKYVNKYLGRQLAYTIGALLSVAGSAMVIFLRHETGCFLCRNWIYFSACLLGNRQRLQFYDNEKRQLIS